MCYDHDARPPLPPIRGAALDAGDLILTSADGTAVAAYAARAAQPTGAGMLVLPDVRGLHPFYEELALRFAEAGIDAVAIDYFSRTAGTGRRGPDFEYMPHVARCRPGTLAADAAAGAAHLRSPAGGAVQRLSSVGFCFGGRLSFLQAAGPLKMAGVIGFYGWPVGGNRAGLPAPADEAARFGCPVLAVWGGADEGIGPEVVAEFEAAMQAAGTPHRSVTYPGAPHSFFDRRATEHADASADAWRLMLDFVADPLAATARR